MRIIYNETITFRCPNVLKERLIEFGSDNDLHVSAVIRRACSELTRGQSAIPLSLDTPSPTQRPLKWSIR